LSGDGVPMVIHDDELSLHTNQGKRSGWTSKVPSIGRVSKLTRKQLQNLRDFDLGKGDKILTLKEMLGVIGQFNRKSQRKQKGKRKAGKMRYANIELKQPGRAVALKIFEVIKGAQKELNMDRIHFCGFDPLGMVEIRKLVEKAKKRGVPLRNRFGKKLKFEYSWGNTSPRFFKKKTVFAKGYVAYKTFDDVKKRPFQLASTDSACVHAVVRKAKEMKMTSLDITSSDFDRTIAKVLAETGMKVVVTHVATRTARQCECLNWGRKPTSRKAQEKGELYRVMKLAQEYGVHLSYKADFPGSAVQLKREFDPKKSCGTKTKRDVKQFVKSMAFALIMDILEQLGFSKPPRGSASKGSVFHQRMLKLWSAVIARRSKDGRMEHARKIYRDPQAKNIFEGFLQKIVKARSSKRRKQQKKQRKVVRMIMKQYPKEMRSLANRIKTSLEPKALREIRKLVEPLATRCSEKKRCEIVHKVTKMMDRKHYKVAEECENFCKIAWAVRHFFL